MNPSCSHACREYNELSRRSFLGIGGGTLLAASVPAWLPRVVFAKDQRSSRQILVSIFLRGGADGLSLCVPHGDPLYYAASGPTARPTIAIPPPGSPNGCTDLDGTFGLSPGMAPLKEAFDNGHLAIVHAAGLTDAPRSHFDAMRFIELGQPSNPGLFTGWLGRHLAMTDPTKPGAVLRGAGIGTYAVPTTMAGGPLTTPVPDPLNYGLWGNPSTAGARLSAIQQMYASSPKVLKDAAKTTQDTIALLDAIDFEHYQAADGAVYPDTLFGKSLKAAAALIKAQVGVEALCLDRGDWDTHSLAEPLTGRLAANMNDLSHGLAAFYRDIFAFSSNIVVVAMSEFGRRPAENASRGTDHGHGNAMFVLGGRVNGGQVYCKDLSDNPGWVGLGNLYEDLDLHITTDYRDVLSEIVFKCLDNPGLDQVFPGWSPQFQGLIT